MFSNFGVTEILIIVLIVVILFGGKKIPELFKGLGSGMKEFKKAIKEGDEEKPSNNNNSK